MCAVKKGQSSFRAKEDTIGCTEEQFLPIGGQVRGMPFRLISPKTTLLSKHTYYIVQNNRRAKGDTGSARVRHRARRAEVPN